MKKIIIFSMFLLVFSINAIAAGEKIIDSANALQKIIQSKSIPKALVNKAVALVVIPDVQQAGLFLGGLMGDGIVVTKSDLGWNEPVYINIKGGSFGLQFGYQKSDMVFFVLNKEVAKDMMNQKITMGVDATITAWDYGKNYVDMTDFKFTSDIYAFASNKGLFAGVSFGGTVFNVNKKNISTTSYATQRWQNVLDLLGQ